MCEGHDKSEASSPAAKSDSEKPQASGANAAKGQANQKARRRTKTGCLSMLPADPAHRITVDKS